MADPTSLTPDQERFLGSYSLGALTYSFFYFQAMGDRQLAWASLAGAFLFPPLMFVLPIAARRRAWERYGGDFASFVARQRAWDRAGLLGLVVLVLLGVLLGAFIARLTTQIGSDPASNLDTLQSILHGE